MQQAWLMNKVFLNFLYLKVTVSSLLLIMLLKILSKQLSLIPARHFSATAQFGNVKNLVVIGAGLMGSGIAQV